jgi:tetratricopeptide (TPR) repeat protein
VKLEIVFIVSALGAAGLLWLFIKYYENRTNSRADEFSIRKAERLDDEGKVGELIEYCESFFRKFPNDVNVNFYLGIGYYRDGQMDKAKAYFESAVHLNPNFHQHVDAYLEKIMSFSDQRKSASS